MKDYILDLDKPRELRFGFKATRAIRQKFGDRNVESLLNIKVDEMPILAWAGMKWDDKTLTVDKVEDLLDDAIPKKYTILRVTEIVLEAFSDHMGITSKKAKADDQKKDKTEKVEAVTEKKKVTPTIPSTKNQKKQP